MIINTFGLNFDFDFASCTIYITGIFVIVLVTLVEVKQYDVIDKNDVPPLSETPISYNDIIIHIFALYCYCFTVRKSSGNCYRCYALLYNTKLSTQFTL